MIWIWQNSLEMNLVFYIFYFLLFLKEQLETVGARLIEEDQFNLLV